MDQITPTLGHDVIDAFEARLVQLPRFNAPTDHTFWKDLYIRQIVMPAGFECSTKVHNLRHAFFISKGVVEVVDQNGDTHLYEAPYWGITEPGTRRALRVLEDCTWSTFHPNPNKSDTPEEIEKDLIQKRDTPLSDQYANARNEQPSQLEEPHAD